ncbi:MAG: Cna B-type domain-containing protein [Erysipelotrichaceae bacterium]|nr:Cna B-type domain-containing protein [Erysipelotrichaceae bacterium]
MFKKIFLIAMFLIASIAYRSISFAQTDSTSEVAVRQEAPLTVETETSADKETQPEEATVTETAETSVVAEETVDANVASVDEAEANLDAGILPATLNATSKQFVFSTNLNQLISNVEISGLVQDGQGNYVVEPHKEYSIDLSFRETETLQFDMGDTDKEFVYTLPSGLEGITSQPTNFTINIVDQNGPASITGNQFTVENGQVKVRFNVNDPNYARLKLLPNVAFALSIKASFDGTQTQIDFGNNVLLKLQYENNASLEITKLGKQRKVGLPTIDYVVTVKTKGINHNVVISDAITGTAISLNKDVVVESSLNGVLSPTITYNETTGVNKGFQFTLPRTLNNEIITVKYSAEADFSKIIEKGNDEQTSNTAIAKSDEVAQVEAFHTLRNNIETLLIVKTHKAIQKNPTNPSIFTVPWTITVNENKLIDMSGRVIEDIFRASSQDKAKFTGDGIVIKVSKKDGSSETRNLKWNENGLVPIKNQDDNNIVGFRYTIPATDGFSSYTIEANSELDSSKSYVRLVVQNHAKILNLKGATGQVTINLTPGVGQDLLTAKKEAVSVNSQEIEWKISLSISRNGYPRLVVYDDNSKRTIVGKTYKDKYIADSLKIEGLYPEETFNFFLDDADTTEANSFSIEFFQDQGKATKGLLPSKDNQSRNLIITYKTRVNQELLRIAHDQGYTDTNAIHFNNMSARVTFDDYVAASRTVTPKLQTIEKKYTVTDTATIAGEAYPVYKYEIVLSNPTNETETILDAFDVNYLKYYDVNGVVIKGGPTAEEQTVVGGNATGEATVDGMKINIHEFPKNAGKLYPFYKVEYSLIVKDKAALDALNALAINAPEGYPLTNTATWNGLTSQVTEAKHTHFPYVDKKLDLNPSSANDYIAEFSIVVNKFGQDLIPNANALSISDTLSDSLRFIPESVVYEPAVNATYNYENNVLTFNDLPDNQKITIKYKAKVLGKGLVNFTNTAKFSNFESKIVNNVNITYTGLGTGSNPSITLFKVDDIDNTKPVQGVVFQLFYVNDAGVDVAVTDKNNNNVTFTTGVDGKVLVVGDSVNLGWALWSDGRTYKLREIARPSWYLAKGEDVTFKFKDIPVAADEYSVVGETLMVQNSRVKTTVTATKTWVNGPASDHVSVPMELTRSSATVAKEVVNVMPEITGTGPFTYTWKDLPKTDTLGNNYTYEVKEQGEVNSVYTTAGGNSYAVSQVGNNITNTYQAAMTSFTATKVWENGPANRPTIMLQLKRNGTNFGQPVALVNQTTKTWDNLPKSDDQGVDYVYSVDEVGTPTNYRKELVNNTTIKNTYVIPNTTVKATKVWVNGPVTDHSAVDIELYRNILGQPEQLVNVAPVLSGTGPFTYTWNNLEQTDIQGNEYIYTVKEKGVVNNEVVINGNTYVVSQVGNTITNTYRSAEISFTGTKVWENGPTNRPSIQLQLKQNGVNHLAPVTLANGTLSYTWTKLPKTDQQGVDYVYSIDEVAVPANYRKTIVDEQTIKNIYDPVVIVPSGGADEEVESVSHSVKIPKTGDTTNTTLYVVFAVAASAGLAYVVLKRKKNRD